jgi:GDP-L-fucose synthase
MERNARIYVAGHRGLVGGALVRRLRARGYGNLLLRTRSELDLTRQEATENFFSEEKPDYVLLAAAKVGGIGANSACGADFVRDNLQIQTHILDCAHRYGVKKLLFLGSSCIYPRDCPQPIREEYLLTGPLEPTNEPYAIAKIAGLIACRAYRRQYGCDFIAVMPTNLYGPGDNDDPETSHVLPALIRKFVEAKRSGLPEVTLWGTGTPRREFLHVDDLASACLFLMERYSGEIALNVGTGEDLTIAELARLIADQVGYGGRILWDPSRPDGTPRKLLDVSRIGEMGWRARIGLEAGVKGILGDDGTEAAMI